MDKEEAIKILKDFHDKSALFSVRTALETLHPELKESEDKEIRKFLIKWIQDNYYHGTTEIPTKTLIAWLEKQGSEPNWCHHKVDLSNCSEEYRKAYYDGWNNCNQQHSQCKSEWNDVVKCLINGMKFYYEGNEEATWGTEKFSMKVKDILSWLEKQELKFNPYSGVSFSYNGNIWGMCARDNGVDILFNKKLIQHISGEKQGEKKQKQYDIDVLEKHITKDSISELAHTVIVRNGWEIVDAKEPQASAWSEKDKEMIDETLYFIREYQQSNRCKDENGMQNSVTCEKWLKSLKERIGGEQ